MILTWCGFSLAATRNIIIDDMLSAPEGLEHLNQQITDGLMSMYREYSKISVADGKIIFTCIQQRRVISLKDWVKDKMRLQETPTFVANSTRPDFIRAIDEASERNKNRINQRKAGKSLVTMVFQVKLQTATQWDRCNIELESKLKMIIGTNGIPLSYVI